MAMKNHIGGIRKAEKTESISDCKPSGFNFYSDFNDGHRPPAAIPCDFPLHCLFILLPPSTRYLKEMEGIQRKIGEMPMNLSYSSCNRNDKEKDLNVQVVLRCRPLSEEEAICRMPTVISCNELRGEVLAIQKIGNKQIDRTFVFDKVFGPTAKQMDLFSQSISPMVSEVLQGFNCTIFAYGQTGSGKTYTMEGEKKTKNGEFSSDAGVIPRSVQQIFEELEAEFTEYSMKVSLLEIYNEEIIDLLAPDEWESSDDKLTKPIALMEDGKGGVFVKGMEEEIVRSADEIYRILDKTSARRQTVETLLNKRSSRSHSIFSITIHLKKFTQEGEEVIKTGKLNLVDLAGSVNVLRSGSVEGRAREAGEINRSLLTLGRVINALVEESSHIPYRDSKLTRLLRDSLGGKTKACIIANISPSIQCLEETLSTLEYAHRARSIKNKPEINQKIMKSVLMKDLYCEIDRLKKEVITTREKKDMYIPGNIFLQEGEKKDMAEKMEHIQVELESKDKQLIVLQELHDSQQHLTAELIEKIENSQNKLKGCEKVILDQEEQYQKAKYAIREKEHLIMQMLHSERVLVEHANCLRSELDFAASDRSELFCKIEHKDNIAERNQIIVQRFQSQLTEQLHTMHKTVSTSVMQQKNQLKEIEEDMQSFISVKAVATKELEGLVDKLKDLYQSDITTLDGLAGELDHNSQVTFGKLYSQVLTHSTSLDDCFKRIAFEADYLLKDLQNNLSKQKFKLTDFVQLQHERNLRTVEATRAISDTVSSYFHNVEVLISRLSKILEETKTSQYQQLSELERKFEECADYEENRLVKKVVQMLMTSKTKQKKLVQAAFDILRESAADRATNLQKEISNAQNLTSLTKEQWKLYMEETENNYQEDIVAVESRRCSLEEGLKDCIQKAEMDSLLWENAQDCLLSLGRATISSMESIVRNGMEVNQLLRANFSSTATTSLEDFDVCSKNLHSSFNCYLKLHNDASENINSIIIPSLKDIWDLKNGHYHKIVEITDCADKCLEQEYMVSILTTHHLFRFQGYDGSTN
ncbi:kinesin-like protein KIN-5A [Dendrobium catenatum]|uniref:kinesin-like protein KIN-5A n=1 Tax=Dendrobium catenatum TaxID=906689 RepID=UPI0009F317CF|nr:kinesin-like protein KIN-5A [Dendrobium catenatum]